MCTHSRSSFRRASRSQHRPIPSCRVLLALRPILQVHVSSMRAKPKSGSKLLTVIACETRLDAPPSPDTPCGWRSPQPSGERRRCFLLQEDIQAMLASIDKSLHGAETGELSKVELREALEAFFLVGQPGGKTLNRMEEIMQASPISP